MIAVILTLQKGVCVIASVHDESCSVHIKTELNTAQTSQEILK